MTFTYRQVTGSLAGVCLWARLHNTYGVPAREKQQQQSALNIKFQTELDKIDSGNVNQDGREFH